MILKNMHQYLTIRPSSHKGRSFARQHVIGRALEFISYFHCAHGTAMKTDKLERLVVFPNLVFEIAENFPEIFQRQRMLGRVFVKEKYVAADDQAVAQKE